MKTGFKAFKQKRLEQKKQTVAHTLSQQILNAEGRDLEQLVKQMVKQGFTLRNGKVTAVAPPRPKLLSQEVLECMITRMASA